ncbi:MAG: DUF3822 family protein [Rikenellaceae bacterium]|jgi:hypothetical protein|nr:DUF3822 family protein [Rikenellaceae bacterium]
MSIRLLLDGHNFSRASHTLRSAGVDMALREVVVTLDSAKTVLVPAYLCEEGVEAAYLRFGGVGAGAGERVVHSEKRGDVVAIMAVNEQVAELIGEMTQRSRAAVRYSSPLLEMARGGDRRLVNIFLTASNAYIVVWDKGLRYAEVLPDASPDSVLYYLQTLTDEFRLRKFEIRIGGVGAEAVVAVARDYYNKVRPIKFRWYEDSWW